MSTNAAPVKKSANERTKKKFDSSKKCIDRWIRESEEQRGKDKSVSFFDFVFLFVSGMNEVVLHRQPARNSIFSDSFSSFRLWNSSEMTVYIKCSGMHRTQNKNAPSGERFDVFDVAMHSKHINCVHRNGVCRKGHTLDLGRPVLPCSSCVFAHKHTHARTHTLGHSRWCWTARASWIVWFIHSTDAYGKKYFLQKRGTQAKTRCYFIVHAEKDALTRALRLLHDESCDRPTTYDSRVCAFNLASARFPEIHIKWNVISMIIFYSKRKWLILVRLVQTFLVYFFHFLRSFVECVSGQFFVRSVHILVSKSVAFVRVVCSRPWSNHKYEKYIINITKSSCKQAGTTETSSRFDSIA